MGSEAKGASLARRALVAVVLMVLFYLLAFAMAAALIVLGIVVLVVFPSAGWLALLLGAIGVVVGLVVLWSILPRFDRFTAPGVEVTERDQPELFAEIRRVAEATREAMPAHVYMLLEMNAFVANRGGVMGIGSKRLMGIGLPMLRALEVGELRAVLAHEMGHFGGGDTKLDPWIYKTRGAVVRTILNLRRVAATTSRGRVMHAVFGVINLPFVAFGKMFMRRSQAISRRQEYAADALAARVAGPHAVISSLDKTRVGGIVYEFFLANDVLPLIALGRLPPIGDGFAQLLASDRARTLVSELERHDAEPRAPADPYDSHPAHTERIAAVRALGAPAQDPDARPAIELVTGYQLLEALVARRAATLQLTPIAWARAVEIWDVHWRNVTGANAAALQDIAIGAIPTIADAPGEVFRRSTFAPLRPPMHRLAAWWIDVVTAALAVRLLETGFRAVVDIGEPIRFTRGDVEIEILSEVKKLVLGKLDARVWHVTWSKLGYAAHLLVEPRR